MLEGGATTVRAINEMGGCEQGELEWPNSGPNRLGQVNAADGEKT